MLEVSVEVLYFAELKEITGKEKERVDLSNHTISELVKILLTKYPLIKEFIWEDRVNNLKESVSIAINDALVNSNDKMSIQLFTDDRVALLLPMSGG